MSTPQLTSGTLTTIVNGALGAINNPQFLQATGNDPFPVCKNEADPNNSMGGNYYHIEAKHILITTMTQGLWEEKFVKKWNQYGLKMPKDCPAGYRVSQAPFWPKSEDNATAGLVTLAADRQADVVADLAFQRLMNLENKSAAKDHARFNKTADQAPTNDDHDDHDDFEMSPSVGSASASSSRAGTPELSAMDIDLSGTATGPSATIPAPWVASKTFRLTRDWDSWPSAGQLQYEVSNCQQAQYGIISDVLFETMKVEVLKAKAVTASGMLGEQNDAITTLSTDTGAQTVYFPILDAFVKEGNKLRKKVCDSIQEDAQSFLDFVGNYEGQLAYRDLNSEEKQFDVELNQFSGDSLPRLFVTLCKQQAATKKALILGRDTQSVTGSDIQDIDDSMSLAGSIDAEANPLNPRPTRGGSRGGRGGTRGTSAIRAPRATLAPRTSRTSRAGPSTTRSTRSTNAPPTPSPLGTTGGSSKRARDDQAEDEEEDEDSEEDQAPTKKNKRSKK